MRPQRGGRVANGVNGMTNATMTWTRLTRRLGSDHNPLRRRSDLIEAWLLPAAIAIFLLLGPLAAGGAVWWAHADNAATQHAQRSWHPVSAVLLQATAGPMMSANGSNSWGVWAQARWSSGGQPRGAEVPAVSGTSAGSTVPVWLDRAGHVQTPLTAAQARDRVIAAASAALAALAVLLAGLALACRALLNRRRLASWETAWRSAGPQWSRPD